MSDDAKGTPLSAWYPILDDLAKRANSDLAAAMRIVMDDKPPPMVTAGALIAIASQLQYGNAIAVADFYLRHSGGLIVLPGREEDA